MTLMRHAVVLVTALLGARGVAVAQRKPAVLLETALIGKDNRVHLRWAGRKETTEPAGEEQVGVADLQIAPDKRAVSWTVERSWDDFGTNYPLPLELTIVGVATGGTTSLRARQSGRGSSRRVVRVSPCSPKLPTEVWRPVASCMTRRPESDWLFGIHMALSRSQDGQPHAVRAGSPNDKNLR